MKVLIGAENFGFGPVSKLRTIIDMSMLSKCYLYFIGTIEIYNFLRRNLELEIKMIDNFQLANKISFDYIVSVMEPSLILYGKYSNIPTCFVDSLFEFWNWEKDDIRQIENLKKSMDQEYEFDNWLSRYSKLSNHQQELLAYLFADEIFVQTAWQVKNRDFLNNKIKKVRPIVDTRFVAEESYERNSIIISLSGMNNPLISKEDNLQYIKFISKVINRTPLLKDALVTVSPQYLDEAKKIIENKVVSLTHTEFLKKLSHSHFVLAPMGLTTFFEALEYKTIFVPLPEYHHGHIWNWRKINKELGNLPKVLISEHCDILGGDINETLTALYKIYRSRDAEYDYYISKSANEISNYMEKENNNFFNVEMNSSINEYINDFVGNNNVQ